jgi:hypothetical protein
MHSALVVLVRDYLDRATQLGFARYFWEWRGDRPGPTELD